MNGPDYKDFFLHPVEGMHRRYEALRSVILEEQPMKEVAQRFQISYGTVRNWVSEFCRVRDVRQSPPFSPRPCTVVPRPINLLPTTMTRISKLPMFGRCRWRRDDD